MDNKRQTKVARVSGEAWHLAQKLAESAGNVPPVSLENYAKELHVRRIRFKPLLSMAGLAKRGKDFEIIVNTEAVYPPEKPERVLSIEDGDWKELPRELRFAVAHEMAHILLMKAANANKQNDVFQKNAEAVENGSNILARILLMPASMMIGDGILQNLFDARCVIEATKRFGVSSEVLIRRLRVSDMRRHSSEGNMDGFLALIRDGNDGTKVKACHMSGTFALAKFNAFYVTGEDKALNRDWPLSFDEVYRQTKWPIERENFGSLGLSEELQSLLLKNQPVETNENWRWDGQIVRWDWSSSPVWGKPLTALVATKVGQVTLDSKGSSFR